MHGSVRGILSITVLTTAVAGRSAAQATYPSVKLTGRLQEQFYYFENDTYAPDVGSRSSFLIRRARVEARGQISENVSVYIQPSFEGGRPLSAVTTCSSTPVPPGGGTPAVTCRTTGRSGLRLRDAYIDVRFGRRAGPTTLYLRGGQEKRPFSRYELTSSVNLPSIERGAGQGLPGRASNNLFEAAGFLAHDVGASLRVEHKLDDARAVTVKVGAYNGQGESLNDVNDSKSFGARGTVALTPKLDLGASWFAHDGIVTVGGVPDSAFSNHAFDLDAQYGKPGDQGLFALAEYLRGTDGTAEKARMWGFQAVAAYNVRMRNPTSLVFAIEPAVRVDLADPNSDGPDDRVTTVTALLGLYLSSQAWLRVGYERQSFEADGADGVSGLRSMLAVSF
ncbi:MAG: porin [Acidimicrobiia bacterium]